VAWKLSTSLCCLQLLACLVGIAAGFVPGISFTGSFWELGLSQFGDSPVRIDQVTPRSPADLAGLRAGDSIRHPGGFDEVNRRIRHLQPGEKTSFIVIRHGEESAVEVTGTRPQVAAIWYADLWYPIAGLLFLIVGLLVFATSPLTPAPLWRSIPVAVTGLGLAVGFAIVLTGGTVFSRFRIWQRWMMGSGEEWYFGQGVVGIATGALLAVLATAEVRRRLSVGLQHRDGPSVGVQPPA
jgi:hypothetical protein